MGRHELCPATELPPGERIIVEVEGLSIGVFNVDGEYHAVNNVCPHQLAPLCEGTLTGTVTAEEVGEYDWERDGRIIRCPWHNWEFDITTGRSVFNPHAVRTRTYDVSVETANSGCSDCPNSSHSSSPADPDDYGTDLAGDPPPVETYEVDVVDEAVVVYV